MIKRHQEGRHDTSDSLQCSTLGALGLWRAGVLLQRPTCPKDAAHPAAPAGRVVGLAANPNSDTVLILLTMQQLTATHHEWDGYEYFGRLAQEQPKRRALFRALQATMQESPATCRCSGAWHGWWRT